MKINTLEMKMWKIIKHIVSGIIYKLSDSSKLPGYFDPEKYVKDKSQINICFQVYFSSTATIKDKNIDANGVKVYLEQNETSFRIRFQKEISNKLFKDLVYAKFGQQWILEYISEMIPYVNREILEQRYKYAYYLLKTFTIIDIVQVRLIDENTNQVYIISGPPGIGEIPLPEIAKNLHTIHIYFRDFVDGVNSYFNANYEDAIRKFITSVENFTRYHGIKRKTKQKSEFIDSIKQNINYVCSMHNRNAADDIIETYLKRNEIVHEGKRIDPLEGQAVCKKAIHAILDVYKQFGDEKGPKEYANTLELQWVANESFLANTKIQEQWKIL